MRTQALIATLALVVWSGSSVATRQADTAALAQFAGTWVGTQAWAIDDPPPGARDDQPVTLTVEVTGGKVQGSLTPFLGSEEGATFAEARLVGEELHATATIGRPRAGGRGRGIGGWKQDTTVALVFRVHDVTMSGTAAVRIGDVPWTRLTYSLGKKRARY